ncbi:regulator of chromosome condensation 1/beta-lactamase-inhibitor protein II [Aspergillus unguis]
MPPKKGATKPAARATAATKKATTAATTTKKSATTKTTTRGRPPKDATAKTTAKTTTKSTATRKPTKAADTDAKKNAKAAPAQPAKKRRADTADEEEPSRTTKRARVAKPAAKQKPKVVINDAPTAKLNVYVCGEGSSGELGLGVGKNVIDVKRPRLNPHLLPDTVGVVQVVVGGMHCVALTHDNKILTWGVNDQGALGRDTTWDGGYKDMDNAGSDSDSDSDDPDLNPHECTPTAISSDAFPEGTVFVQVAAGDSSSFALTDDGQVYGWGTFRSNDGILGFDASTRVQTVPTLLSGLKRVKHLVCGDNHVLALNDKGAVFSWGSGQQNQLGRRIIERNKLNGLQPREFGLPKGIVHIGAGAFHSFAVHHSGKVYAWGLNSFGETGIREHAGDSEAAIVHPTVVDALSKKNVTQICGGAHHSLAVTEDGQCLVWGRLDGYQTGLKIDTLSDDAVIKDERDRPRILIEPTAVPGIKAKVVAAGSDHSIAIDTDGRPWSWGFSATYQTGQGTQDDVEVATVIENTAVRGKSLNWAGGGGQFSVFTEPVKA